MTCRKVRNASNTLAIVPATTNVPVRNKQGPRNATRNATKLAPRAPLHVVPAAPATIAHRATLAPVLAAIQNLEGEAEEYQQWCDAMISSVTWIREAIEAEDMEALEEAMESLEMGVDVSQPVLTKMGGLARALRKAFPKSR